MFCNNGTFDQFLPGFKFLNYILYFSEFQEQVRSGDASATEYFELGAVMLRRKFYPAAIKYLLQAIENWDGDDQDLAQVTEISRTSDDWFVIFSLNAFFY